MQGTIVKGIGGFYYVKTEKELIECKARGKFRFDELTPMVGDRVEIQVVNGKGRIESINKRENQLLRPSVANVTQALIVFAIKNPEINEELLNKFLILCEYNKLKVIVCFNKLDLAEADDNEVVRMIRESGYEVMFIKAKEGKGLEELRERLKGNITVFCGPSGVGKSTILNCIAGKKLMETGDISDRLQRGKHTTRHCELIKVDEGFIVDTPGFSMLDIGFIGKEKLQNFFPEFMEYKDYCKFSGCLHYNEPSCAVKEAVRDGRINKRRYDFYIKTLDAMNNGRK